MEWRISSQIIFLPVVDPDLQIKGGGGSSSPWDKGGPVLKKKFQPFRPQLEPKKGGVGPSPGSATACSHRNYTWSDQTFCAISLLEFVSKCLVLKQLCIEMTGYPLSFLQSCLGEDAVEPWYNGVSKEGKNIFAAMKFCYIEVLFHIFYYYWGKENCLLHRGLRYIEVCYINVPLY